MLHGGGYPCKVQYHSYHNNNYSGIASSIVTLKVTIYIAKDVVLLSVCLYGGRIHWNCIASYLATRNTLVTISYIATYLYMMLRILQLFIS